MNVAFRINDEYYCPVRYCSLYEKAKNGRNWFDKNLGCALKNLKITESKLNLFKISISIQEGIMTICRLFDCSCHIKTTRYGDSSAHLDIHCQVWLLKARLPKDCYCYTNRCNMDDTVSLSIVKRKSQIRCTNNSNIIFPYSVI